MNKLKQEIKPKIRMLHTRKAIKAIIRRLKIRDLLSEVVQDIRGRAEQDPNGKHISTAIDTNGIQSLCVCSVFASGIFTEFGIFADVNCRIPEEYNGLWEFSELFGTELSKRMTKDGFCDECKAKIERSVVSIKELDLHSNKITDGVYEQQ